MIQTPNTDKLNSLLEPHLTACDVLQEALKEVSEEQAAERKEKAKGLIRQALDLQLQMNNAERDFLAAKKKFDKQLGKVIRQLNNMAGNRPLNEGIEEEAKEEQDSET